MLAKKDLYKFNISKMSLRLAKQQESDKKSRKIIVKSLRNRYKKFEEILHY